MTQQVQVAAGTSRCHSQEVFATPLTRCDLTRARKGILSDGQFLVGYLLLINEQQTVREALGNFYIDMYMSYGWSTH